MGAAIKTYGPNSVDPYLYPDDARTRAVRFAPSLTVVKGQVVAQITASKLWAAYNNANSDGTETAKAIAKYSFKTDTDGKVSFQSGTDAPEWGEKEELAPIYIRGYFLKSDFTNLDAAAVVELGRIISGVFADADAVIEIV